VSARVGLLAILHGEGKEVTAFHGPARRHHGGQHHRATIADDHGAVGLLGDLASFQRERTAVELDLYGVARHESIFLQPYGVGTAIKASAAGTETAASGAWADSGGRVARGVWARLGRGVGRRGRAESGVPLRLRASP